MTDSLIHLRVPVATKARWVRANRDSGGAPDPVADDLIAEASISAAADSAISRGEHDPRQF